MGKETIRPCRRRAVVLPGFWAVIALGVAWPASVEAQWSGVPFSNVFTAADYGASGQNWAVATDSKGSVYIGNTDGLLVNDGTRWRIYPMPQRTIVRSLWHDSGERVYAGSFEEFGFFARDPFGRLLYTSLSDSLPGYEFRNDEIWDIAPVGDEVCFRSFSSYFLWDGVTVRAVTPPGLILYLTSVDGRAYAFLQGKGLYRFDGEHFTQLTRPQQTAGDNVVGILPHTDGLLLLTVSKGIFMLDADGCRPWAHQARDQLRKAILNRAVMTRDSVYVIGTISDGIYALDRRGRLLWQMDASHGLPNETVLGLRCDSQNNVWVATDNGAAYVRHGSPLRFFSPAGGNIGHVYSAIVHRGKLYMATNKGVFAGGLGRDDRFAQVAGISGQAWEFHATAGQLLCGHNSGTSQIDGTASRLASPVMGGTCFREGTIRGQRVMLQSTYTKLVVYRPDGRGGWRFSHPVEGFMNPVRQIEIDSRGDVWALHFYRGLYRTRLDETLTDVISVTPYLAADGHRRPQPGSLFKVRGRIAFADGERFYAYDELADTIRPYELLNRRLPDYAAAGRVVKAAEDEYWLTGPRDFILVQFLEGDIRILRRVVLGESDGPLRGYENVTLLDDGSFLFCLENGVALLDGAHARTDTLPEVYPVRIMRVEAHANAGRTALLELDPASPPRLASAFGNVDFEAACGVAPGGGVRYSFLLEGVENRWSEPSRTGRRQYERLPSGDFVFRVKALGAGDRELGSAAYRFSVRPAWWAHPAAILLYVLSVLALLYASVQIASRRAWRQRVRQQAELRALRLRELEREKRRSMKQENLRLETDLANKSKELAEYAFTIIRKNEVLSEVRRELTDQKLRLGTQYPDKYFRRLTGMIDSRLASDEEWAVFNANFDLIHENFFRNLKADYPLLTPTDLRFCALLRLNFDSKQIASLLGISLKGVETARYRLRRKLSLGQGADLIDFMIRFGSEN